MPKSWLKMSMQSEPQDGVAALADVAPAAPTPPIRVSVAAAAKTLLLMDMQVPFMEPQPYPAHGCSEPATGLAVAWSGQERLT